MELTGEKKRFLMPSFWEGDDLEDGAFVQLFTSTWNVVGPGGGAWDQPLAHSPPTGPQTELSFKIIRIQSATCPAPPVSLLEALGFGGPSAPAASPRDAKSLQLALEAPNGKLLAANPAGEVAATAPRGAPPSSVFKVTKSVGGFTVQCVEGGRYLTSGEGGRLFLGGAAAGGGADAPPPPEGTLFRARAVELVPKFFGANLGGWLVTEGWMSPKELYEGVDQDIIDSTTLQLQSAAYGAWVAAEGGGGDRLVADRPSPSGWETFRARRLSGGGLQIRCASGHFWTVDRASGAVSATQTRGGQQETFGLRRKVGDRSQIQLRASNGKWVRAAPAGALIADVDDDAPSWATSCTFTLGAKCGVMGGECQLAAALGAGEAAARLRRHRDTWVTREDFEWLARQGATAVRVPVGFWAAEDPTPTPFVEGSLAYLDKAFEWAQEYGLRVVLCLHAAPGSQNGWEHSASQDGVAEWGAPHARGENVPRTLRAIEFLVRRYSKHPQLAGVEPLNEPTTGGAPFDVLAQYYKDSYALVRKHAPKAYFVIGVRIFGNPREWDDFMTGPEYTNVIMDDHWYQVHDTATFAGMSAEDNIRFPAKQRAAELRLLERGRRLVYIGEWSLALNSETSDKIYRRFGEAQVAAYSAASAGFFFWSLKHGQGWDSWSFRASVDKGHLEPRWWGPPPGPAEESAPSDRSEL